MDYGTVDYNDGITLEIAQQPYIGGGSDEGYYVAIAHDEDCNEYEVRWEINSWVVEDESDCCDWTKYTVRKIG